MLANPSSPSSAHEISWLERLSGYIWRYRCRSLVQEMKTYVPETLARLINDLDWKLEEGFEQELEREIDATGYFHLVAEQGSGRLLPATMRRFGLDPVTYEQHCPEALSVLHEACRTCPATGRCWRAIKRGRSAETWSGFCSNAAALARSAPVG